MHRQGDPEADLVGTRGHVVAVDVVGIGDPESRTVLSEGISTCLEFWPAVPIVSPDADAARLVGSHGMVG